MPAYNVNNPPPFLGLDYPLNQYVVFSKETLTLNGLSQQVGVPSQKFAGAKGIRVEIDFNANPGNVEIDVMESDSDTGATSYVQVPIAGALTQASIVTGPNGASTRLVTDLQPFSGAFVALLPKVVPSNAAITCTARITRAG